MYILTVCFLEFHVGHTIFRREFPSDNDSNINYQLKKYIILIFWVLDLLYHRRREHFLYTF